MGQDFVLPMEQCRHLTERGSDTVARAGFEPATAQRCICLLQRLLAGVSDRTDIPDHRVL